MDSQQQWENQHQSDQQQQPPVSHDLALFAPQPNSTSKATTPDSSPTRHPRIGGFFTLVQWQELELQALIYKYMLAGAPVPVELILPIRRSLLNTASPYQHHHTHQYQHLQHAMLQARYWGGCGIDPEPGRCRRTDGKKWRCSREVVAGQKYCERHVHRGRNRSRKHVEIPTPTGSSGLKFTPPSPLGVKNESNLTLSGSSSPALDIVPVNQRPPDDKMANGCLPQGYLPNFTSEEMQGDKADSRVLKKFFDDWPRMQQEFTPSNRNATLVSPTQLSISMSENPSDFSLKLSTGSDDKPEVGSKDTGGERVQPPVASWSGWRSQGEASMGGPLAEALRSSTSTHSPTDILQKPIGTVSEIGDTGT